MNRALLPVLAGLALAGCVTPGHWSEAPRGDGWYAASPPVGWWGQDAASVELFYGPLARYGQWDLHPRYGRVWLPGGVGPGWQPYTRGYWRADPRYGRLWISGEPFGWATYHYGRWGHDARFGWFWVPDVRFGPSWVDWRSGPSHAWWAPLPPPGWVGHGWQDRWWVHAPHGYLWRQDLWRHARPGRPAQPGTRPDRGPDPRPDPIVVERPEPGVIPFDPNRHPRSSPRPDTPVAGDGLAADGRPVWRGGTHPRSSAPARPATEAQAVRPPEARPEPVAGGWRAPRGSATGRPPGGEGMAGREGWSRPPRGEGMARPARPAPAEGASVAAPPPAASRPAAVAPPRFEPPAPPPRREAAAPSPRSGDLPRAQDD